MSSVEIPNAIQEALRDENWRKTINEEMQALEKNETLGYGLSFLKGTNY